MDGVMKEEDKRGGIQAGSGKVGRGGKTGVLVGVFAYTQNSEVY